MKRLWSAAPALLVLGPLVYLWSCLIGDSAPPLPSEMANYRVGLGLAMIPLLGAGLHAVRGAAAWTLRNWYDLSEPRKCHEEPTCEACRGLEGWRDSKYNFDPMVVAPIGGVPFFPDCPVCAERRNQWKWLHPAWSTVWGVGLFLLFCIWSEVFARVRTEGWWP